MKAIAIVPGTAGSRLVERPEPSITTPDEVKIRMIRVGICGTDREEVSGGRAQAPDGQNELVIGHEMFGQVVSVGSSVTRVKPGDYAVFTVRRGCGECAPCLMNRTQAKSAFHQVVGLGKQLHHRVLDAVVDHFDEMPGRSRAQVGYARLSIDFGSYRLKHRANPLVRLFGSPGA